MALSLKPRLLWVALPAALFLILTCVQILGPRPIGVADNNDFAKVLGTLNVWAAPQFASDHHLYLVTDYLIDETKVYDAEMPSSEFWIAAAAKQIGKLLLPPGHFDMRVLGALHALLAALAIWLCLSPLQNWPWRPRAGITALFLLIFSDAEYVQFFNTAYMDAGSLILLMLVFAVGWNVSLDPQKANWRWALGFCLVGTLFLGTKLQHQLCLVPLLLFCVLTALRTPRRADRAVWLLAPLALVATTCFMISETPLTYLADSRFSAVFSKMVPLSQSPEQALRELGRPATDLQYIHWQAYSPGSPLANPDYRAKFVEDITTAKIAAFYLRHPGIAFQVLRSDFLAFSPEIPVANFGTMRRSDSQTPVFHAHGLTLWSDLRSGLCKRWPIHIPLLYLLVWLLLVKSKAPALALAISVIGCLSFALGSLYDATETSRHILLYQEATDMLFIVAISSVSLGAVRICSINSRLYGQPDSRSAPSHSNWGSIGGG